MVEVIFLDLKKRIKIMNKDLKLNSVDWKEFKLNDLFDRIEKGKCKNTKEETKQSLNGVSFLSAKLNNNGVSGFVEPNSLLQKGNCIMFVNQGDGGAGYSVYKKEDFISTTSNSFGYAKWINKYTGLFVASILCRFKEKYAFGYGRTENRLRKDKVFLPINSEGQPHWEFMENYMKQIEEKQKQKLIEYFENKIKILQNNIIEHDLNDIKWTEFTLNKVFPFIMRGKRLIERDRIKGNIPYYSASKENNGLTDMIENPLFIERDKLIISTFCNCFFVEGEFTASDEITIFGNNKLNKYNGLFISYIVKSNAIKYAFGFKAFSERLARQIVYLPIDSKGEPHWEFMENFMREVEYKKLNLYLDYIKKSKPNL